MRTWRDKNIQSFFNFHFKFTFALKSSKNEYVALTNCSEYCYEEQRETDECPVEKLRFQQCDQGYTKKHEDD